MPKLHTTLGQLAPLPEIAGVQFAHVSAFPGYAVSDDGRAWSCRQGRPWTPLKPAKAGGRRNYYQISLCRDGRVYSVLVHGLVLRTFTGSRPAGYEAAHDNGNSFDNRLVNLKWKTHRENTDDIARHGRVAKGEVHGMSKLTVDQVRCIRKKLAIGLRHRDIAKEYGVARTTITNIDNSGWAV